MRIVYNSFAGRCSDNPRAVWERLLELGDEHEHVWLADPAHLHGFPPGTTTVEIGSPDSIAALESADALVANTHTEVEWRKPPGALYLQTWHGTPLKRIHHDVLPMSAPGDRLARLDRDVARWDLLLSPNPVSTERLRAAFRFTGEVAETGYPRNDVLVAGDRGSRRAQVREALGIAEHTTAVLYTPTYRDDAYHAEGDIELALDFEAFVERFGDDAVLLPRLHYMMTSRMAPLVGPGLRDVSTYPDVRDLYLAADAMVTDYSSTMFDFAVTGRPMVFYAYDLPAYRDSVRGLYFDPAPHLPGPLVETTGEVLASLGDLDAVRAQHADRYTAFVERYCCLEDGHATDRVVDLLLRGS